MEKIFILFLTNRMKRTIAIGEINKVSINNPMSEETLIFFLIKPYKLNVTATVIPIHGITANLNNK